MKKLPANTPLDSWILRKMGMPGNTLKLNDLQNYQLERLNETIGYARLKSPYYSLRLSDFPTPGLRDLSGISELPFTTAEDIRADSRQFLTLPPHEIARIVTLQTSGTTGSPKRVFFTREDLDHTIDFFGSGMSIFVKPGQRVLICLPGDQPDSVGDLLVRGLERIGAQGIVHGPVRDIRSAIEAITDLRIDCLVGIPTQVLSLARSQAGKAVPRGRIKSVLLSTDYMPQAIADALVRTWDCRVFNHYGITEMGLGAAVECVVRDGYHLREADLFFEIVGADSGEPLSDGETGEIVITTLTRKGMPLIRYRTGDLSRVLTEPCSCGSVTKRIAIVRERLNGRISLVNGSVLTLPDLDEALFRVEAILNYRAALTTNDGHDCLEIALYVEEDEKTVVLTALDALKTIPAISAGLSAGTLQLAPISLSRQDWFTTGVAKRTIIDNRAAK